MKKQEKDERINERNVIWYVSFIAVVILGALMPFSQ